MQIDDKRIRNLFRTFEDWLNKLNVVPGRYVGERYSIWHIFVQIFQICDFDIDQLPLLCVVLSGIPLPPAKEWRQIWANALSSAGQYRTEQRNAIELAKEILKRLNDFIILKVAGTLN